MRLSTSAAFSLANKPWESVMIHRILEETFWT